MASVVFHAVIPARYASSRLPAKPLLDIAGKPMVVRVAEQAAKSGAVSIVIATDHPEILKVVNQHGFQAILTSESHASGTDRIAEVARHMQWADNEIVVNVQGDEPLIDPLLIDEVAANLAHHQAAAMATVCHPIHDKASMLNPNVVKVVMDADSYAMYFSRAPIPYPRDVFAQQQEVPAEISVFRHVGIYAYRAGFLGKFSQLAAAEIEKVESLEQLRVLWHGYKISVAITKNAPATGVDTEQDLANVRQLFAAQQS